MKERNRYYENIYIVINYDEKVLEVEENSSYNCYDADHYFSRKYGIKYMGMFTEWSEDWE